LVDASLGIDSYRDILGRLYGFWRGWQPQLTRLMDDPELLEPRQRLHLLTNDLAALGVSRDALAALPRCPLVPLHNAAEALGSLYVMEGSTLGGKTIRINVETCLGALGRASCSYFIGYGHNTGTMWRAFLIHLDAAPANDFTRIGSGAVMTFERLGWWLTKTADSPSPADSARNPTSD
jgi:heme oxygenase